MKPASIHPSAFVASDALVGAGTKVWHLAQIREGATVGEHCILGKGAYVGEHVHIGSRVKIQNGASIYPGSTLEDGVFIGPHVCLTNDKRPRAIKPDGTLKTEADWEVGRILVRMGASIGASSVVVPGVTIGRWAMVGAGAVVTHSVPDYGLVAGNPGRLVGYVCACGNRLAPKEGASIECVRCKATYVWAAEGRLAAARDAMTTDATTT